MPVRVSTPEKEGVYQAARWLKWHVLCDAEELSALFEKLEPFSIFPLTGIVSGKPIEKGFFLEVYRGWIEGLKRGSVPESRELRQILAAVCVENEEAIWLQEVPGRGYLVKQCKAALQLQAHAFTYSRMDGVFRPMSMGEGSIFWGLQFSFPQVCQDGKTKELYEVKESRLVQQVRGWVREKTRATPFLVEGKRMNVPIRLGKGCFTWIQNHPKLVLQGIEVDGSG